MAVHGSSRINDNVICTDTILLLVIDQIINGLWRSAAGCSFVRRCDTQDRRTLPSAFHILNNIPILAHQSPDVHVCVHDCWVQRDVKNIVKPCAAEDHPRNVETMKSAPLLHHLRKHAHSVNTCMHTQNRKKLLHYVYALHRRSSLWLRSCVRSLAACAWKKAQYSHGRNFVANTNCNSRLYARSFETLAILRIQF